MAADPTPSPTPSPGPLAGEGLPVPTGFVRDVIERRFDVPHPRGAVWGWLCDPSTFTDSQVPPWRVEFVDPATGAPGDFSPGVLTTHHGPLMNFCGVIGEVDAPRYRDLPYTYGAYALSPRLARPVRLEFTLDEAGPDATVLHLRVTADVRTWFRSLWRWGNGLFWSRFGTWCDRSLRRG